MARESLNAAVERLLVDRGFARRFRRNPERALRRYGLGADEVEALKRGRADELLALGVDPEYVWPRAEAAGLEPWLLRNARRLAPVTLLAALTLVGAPTALAARQGRARALRRLGRHAALRRTGLRRAFARTLGRERHSPPGIRRAIRRAGPTGIRRAIRRIAPEPPIDVIG